MAKKDKSVPYRLAIFLLYGEFPWLTRRIEDGIITVQFPANRMARLLLISRERLDGYLSWTASRLNGTMAPRDRYRVSISLPPPTGWSLPGPVTGEVERVAASMGDADG